MLDELLESKAEREPHGRGTLVSVAAHAVVVILVAVATGSATPGPAPEKPPEVVFRFVPEPPRDPLPAAPTRGAEDAGDGRRAPTLPPIEAVVPGIPPVDLGPRVPWTDDLTLPPALPVGSAGGAGVGEPAGGAPGVALPSQVDRVALLLPGGPTPRYPDGLRQAGIEGEVVAQFVVDSSGRVDPRYVKILRADHELFVRAVRNALGGMRFAPAEAGGRKVAQLVQLPFHFTIAW